MISRFRYWYNADRIGPDIPLTHWRLHFPHLMKNLCEKKFRAFGNQSAFRPGAYAVACKNISIGDFTVIRSGSMLFANPDNDGGEIIIGKKVLMGSCVHIYTVDHEFLDVEKPIYDQGNRVPASVIIGDGAWIGAGAILLPGVEIGKNAIVGAGSIVTKNVPDYCVSVGNPSKVIKNLKN